MRFYPFGSASKFEETITGSSANYSFTAEYGLRTLSASYAISGSKGPPGDNGTPSTTVGPYDTYPPTC